MNSSGVINYHPARISRNSKLARTQFSNFWNKSAVLRTDLMSAASRSANWKLISTVVSDPRDSVRRWTKRLVTNHHPQQQYLMESKGKERVKWLFWVWRMEGTGTVGFNFSCRTATLMQHSQAMGNTAQESQENQVLRWENPSVINVCAYYCYGGKISNVYTYSHSYKNK